MTPGRGSLESLLRRCGIELTRTQYDQLWHYHQLLRNANAALNLTRIHQFDNMVLKHYVDSLLVLRFTELPSPLVDMGSGPGLPGIPLKIARPDVEMILAEPRGARADFLSKVCAALGLEKVEVYANKVGSRFPHRVEGVITRAVASIPETLDRVARCIVPGGRMLFMKGPECDEEIREAAQSHGRWFKLTDDHAYDIPWTEHHRRLVIYERTDAPRDDRDDTEPTASGATTATAREVTSEANPAFKLARDLLSGRGIRKNRQALISGTRFVEEVVERVPDRLVAWLTPPDGAPPPIEGLAWLRLAKPLFQEIDVAGTHAPIVQVSVPEFPTWSASAPWPEGCTLFVPFQDPENVGAVIRSAAAFGVPRVVLLSEAAHPFHPKSVRAAGPALFATRFEVGPSIKELRTAGVPLIALHAEGRPIDETPFPATFGLVPGIEGPGLPENLRGPDARSIPITPEVESLNAGVAAAIALYLWSRSNPRTTAE
ncbi:MAG: 16S rRNA (guanine(527)-N(7))-methyltransferase RsmG [Isosphaeraceae bacterium]|nr:16S rRNA (guanine(527)-N(7))-methyltransferase RsmG [Isosphaeraceae bacterium]